MNKHLAKDLELYADMLAEGELVSPDDLNCSAVMRLAAEALAQPGQEVTNLERHERNVQQLFGTPQPKEPEQEPVAWGVIASNTGKMCQVELDYDEVSDINSKWLVPLYTIPPQRPSRSDIKPLTDEQIDEAIQQHVDPVATYRKLHDFARAIEAAHGIKGD